MYTASTYSDGCDDDDDDQTNWIDPISRFLYNLCYIYLIFRFDFYDEERHNALDVKNFVMLCCCCFSLLGQGF